MQASFPIKTIAMYTGFQQGFRRVRTFMEQRQYEQLAVASLDVPNNFNWVRDVFEPLVVFRDISPRRGVFCMMIMDRSGIGFNQTKILTVITSTWVLSAHSFLSWPFTCGYPYLKFFSSKALKGRYNLAQAVRPGLQVMQGRMEALKGRYSATSPQPLSRWRLPCGQIVISKNDLRSSGTPAG